MGYHEYGCFDDCKRFEKIRNLCIGDRFELFGTRKIPDWML